MVQCLLSASLAVEYSPAMLEPTWFDHYEREAQVCRGVPPNYSPLEELGVDDLRPIASFTGRPRVRRTQGVRLFLRNQPGWSADRLQRESECRITRQALLLPHERQPSDPLAVEGVRAEVRRTGDGWEVWLRGRDREAGPELLRRARTLVD